MTYTELWKKLKKAGWTQMHGAKHDMAVNPNTNQAIAIPRHKGDIPIGTAKAILRQAGLK